MTRTDKLDKLRRMAEPYAAMACGVMVFDADAGIVDANSAAEEILGVSFDQMRGKALPNLVWRATREDGSDLPREDHPCLVALRTGEPQRDVALGLSWPNAERRWLRIDAVPVFDDAGAVVQVVTSFIDLTDRKRVEEGLRHQSLHDALTGLPNRTLLHDRLEQALLVARRDVGSLALLLMDLDGFKEVNDTLGHHYGDLLLQGVAGRLHDVLRASDTVGRLGGDEFAVVLPTADEGGAIEVVRHIGEALAEPFMVEDHHLSVAASIGIALYPVHGHDGAALLRVADRAMYAAKRAGSGYVVAE